MQDTTERLEYLRGQLRAECISWGELHELQGLAEHIDPSDAELREAAGLPEHDDETVEGVYIVTIRNTGDERAIDGADIRQALRDYATTMGTADSLISVDVESA